MRRVRLLLLAALLLPAAGLLRSPSLNLPLERDEGEFASLAWLWSSGHGLPYRDYLEQKPPATLGLHAVAQAACSDGVRGLRWLSLAWIAATALALALLLLRLQRRQRRPLEAGQAWWGALAAGLLAAVLLSSSRTQSLAANTETWLSLPLIGALALAFGGAPTRGRWLAAGFCLGVASLFKQPVLAGLLLLPLAAQPGEGELLPLLGWCSLGAAAAWLLALLPFGGGALDVLNCTWAYNQGYVLSGWTHAWRPALGLALWLAPELGGAVLLALLGWFSLGPGPLRRALAAWLGVALVLLLAGGRFYPHYAIGLLAPLAALAGLGLAAPRWPRLLRGGLLLLAGLGWAYCNGQLWAAPDGAARSVHLYGLPNFAAAPKAAELIQRYSPAERPLFIWGDEPELYYLSRRAPASRFLFTYPFTGEAPAWPGGESELRAALHAPDLGAAVLAKPLDARNPLQMEIQTTLQERFDADPSVPPYLVGRPKP